MKKKSLTKIVSLVLSAVMILSCLPIFASATANTKNDPIIYVRGDSCDLTDADGNEISKSVETDRVVEIVKTLIFPYFVDAVTSNTDEAWQTYYDKFCEEVGSIYAQWRLDDNGENSNGTGIAESEIEFQDRVFNTDYEKNGEYFFTGDLFTKDECHFWYDYRLDPFINADRLKERIDQLKAATGHDKIQLSCLCYGGEVVLAYLQKYGTDDISTLFFDTTVSQGTVPISGIASGKVKLDGDAIQRTIKDTQFRNENDVDGTDFGNTMYAFLSTTVEMLNQYSVIKFAALGLTPFLDKIAHEILPRAFMVSYGTCPGYWALVSNDDFDDAIKNVFSVEDYDVRFAGLKEKVLNYHEKVSSRYMEILEGAKANGVKIGVISKYGWSNTPVFDTIDELGDRLTLCRLSSFGATCSSVTGTLGKDYIAKQTEKGLERYISPDRQVDASTCLVPDQTWFTKGVEHDHYTSTRKIQAQFHATNGNFTIYDDPNFPQYLVIDRETVHIIGDDQDDYAESVKPMTTENMNEGTNWENATKPDHMSPKSFYKAVTEWFQSLVKAIKAIFDKLLTLIKNK